MNHKNTSGAIKICNLAAPIFLEHSFPRNKKMAISQPNGQKSKKIKALSSYELLEFNEANCFYSFDFRPIDSDMGIFLFLKNSQMLLLKNAETPHTFKIRRVKFKQNLC